MTEASVFESDRTIRSWDDDYYHPIARRYYDRAVTAMLRLMKPEPGAAVLDAGCGPGEHTVRVARAGYRVCAVDLSQAMLHEAEARIEKAGVRDAVELRREDLTRLSLPDASFRYAFSWGVVIHIPDIERALRELARILAPGGKLALYVTNRRALDHGIEAVLRLAFRKPQPRWERRPLGVGRWFELHGERLWVWRIDAQALRRYLATLGLRQTHQSIGEFTELQRRLRGPLRRLLLRFNNLCHRLGLPPGPAVANLLIFEKAC